MEKYQTDAITQLLNLKQDIDEMSNFKGRSGIIINIAKKLHSLRTANHSEKNVELIVKEAEELLSKI